MNRAIRAVTRRERGSVTLATAGIAVLVMALCSGLVHVARAARASSRAAVAADAAALAAMGELAAGRNVRVAYRTAQLTAARNGARLIRCQCHGPDVLVTVAVDLGGVPPFSGRAHAGARAEIVPHCPGSGPVAEQESAVAGANSDRASSKWRRRLASTGIETAGPASPG